MSLKLCIVITTLFASATAIEYLQQVIPAGATVSHSNPAAYSFQYRVHDEHTGDIKGHSETRNGDRVDGQYDLIDSDGYKRTVQYAADEHSGFQATVLREPTGVRIQKPLEQQNGGYVEGHLTGEQQQLFHPHTQYTQ